MKAGDLVKMKFISFWMKKHGHGSPGHVAYTETPMLVLEAAHNAIKVILPDGKIKSDLAEHYDVVSEAVELTDEQLEYVVGGQTREKFEGWRCDMINEYRSGLLNSKKSM